MKRVLVVEDDGDIRDVLATVLSSAGYEPVGAADGVEALEMLHAGPAPACALIDLMMPNMNGTELLQEMRGDEALAGIPVAIFSGDTRAAEAARAIGGFI